MWSAHLEGKHQLVALKQAEAGVVVHVESQSLHNVPQPSLQARSLHTAWRCTLTLCSLIRRQTQHAKFSLQLSQAGYSRLNIGDI